MHSLPQEGRVFRTVSKDPLTYQDHLTISILDAQRNAAYFSMVGAQGSATKKSWGQVLKNAPKPMPRPGREVEQKRVKHIRAVDGLQAIEQWKKNAVAGAKAAHA